MKQYQTVKIDFIFTQEEDIVTLSYPFAQAPDDQANDFDW